MPVAAGFWDANGHWVSAVVSVVVALAVAVALDRALAHRGHDVAEAVAGRPRAPAAAPRRRGARRGRVGRPNLASVLVGMNDTLRGDTVRPEASLWLPHPADVGRAVALLEAETGAEPRVSETTVAGVCVTVDGDPCPPDERGPREAALRLRCLARLHEAGLLG